MNTQELLDQTLPYLPTEQDWNDKDEDPIDTAHIEFIIGRCEFATAQEKTLCEALLQMCDVFNLQKDEIEEKTTKTEGEFLQFIETIYDTIGSKLSDYGWE